MVAAHRSALAIDGEIVWILSTRSQIVSYDANLAAVRGGDSVVDPNTPRRA